MKAASPPRPATALFVAGVSALTLMTMSARAQSPSSPPPSTQVVGAAWPCPPVYVPNCPTPYPVQPNPLQPNPVQPNPVQPNPVQPNPEANNAPNVETDTAGSGARGGESVSLSPNIIGDLLRTSRSVRFGFVRVNGNTDFTGLASTSIFNSSVDENNSPLPEDRVYFRYNYFNNGQSVTGLSPFTSVLAPGRGNFPPALNQLPQTKSYDTNLYTFGAEKTFFDDQMSVELRVPFVSGLASHNTLSVGNPGAPAGGNDTVGNQQFNVISTPQNTLGQEDTEFGDLTLVFKGLLYQDRCSGLYVSGGTGLTIPTGQDAQVTAIDYAGITGSPLASIERQRSIQIANETWSISPFVAALYTPNDRLFTQGFASVEVPLGSSRVSYNESYLRGVIPPGSTFPGALPSSLVPPFSVNNRIDEQTLLHLDWNVGYWIYRAPESRWLTGVAPCFEVHYTGTLNKADRVQLPGDANFANLNPTNPTGAFVPDVGPVVGGQNSSVNILDLTAGSTFTFGQRTTLAAAFTVPVTNGSNRAFDYEFQLQLNYYFGR